MNIHTMASLYDIYEDDLDPTKKKMSLLLLCWIG
jgi:hypothetical protein